MLVGGVIGGMVVSEPYLLEGVVSVRIKPSCVSTVSFESWLCLYMWIKVISHSSTIIPVSVLIVLVVGVGGVELKNLTSARWTH